MASATKRSPEASKKSGGSVSAQFDKLIGQAVADWRQWADDIATGKPGPDPQRLLEVAAVLAVRDPGAALEADARVVADVRHHEDRVRRSREALAADMEKHGGRQAIAEKIAALEAEIKNLKSVTSPFRAMATGHIAGEIIGMKNQNPRLFNPSYVGEPAR